MSKSSSIAKKRDGSARAKAAASNSNFKLESNSEAREGGGGGVEGGMEGNGSGEYTLTDHYLEELFKNAPTLSQLLSHATLEGYHDQDRLKYLRHLHPKIQSRDEERTDATSEAEAKAGKCGGGDSTKPTSTLSGSPSSGTEGEGSGLGAQPPVKSATDFSYSATSYAGENYRIVGDAGGEYRFE